MKTLKPSDFLAAGFPYGSIFGECWHESTAFVILEAMLHLGDEWRELTPEQVREAMREQTSEQAVMLDSILFDSQKLQRVAQVLTSAEDARRFSSVWSRVGEEDQNALEKTTADSWQKAVEDALVIDGILNASHADPRKAVELQEAVAEACAKMCDNYGSKNPQFQATVVERLTADDIAACLRAGKWREYL